MKAVRSSTRTTSPLSPSSAASKNHHPRLPPPFPSCNPGSSNPPLQSTAARRLCHCQFRAAAGLVLSGSSSWPPILLRSFTITDNYMAEEEHEVGKINLSNEEDPKSNEVKGDKRKVKKKKRLQEEAKKAEKRGICYLSRIPPHMDPLKLRQILSQHGEIQRIYLTPENPAARVQRKQAGGFRGQEFSEGWVEFTKKSAAKRVAKLLNGEQMGGRKRSSFFYDLWNIKYLSKFKWDDLTGEIAYKNAIREQKLALEISAAKRERDFYMSKVDQSHALNSIEERIKKKQKVREESGATSEISDPQFVPKVIRQFPQKKPVAVNAEESRPRLSMDILAGIFGGTS